MERFSIVFTGRVQGVGFRYTAESIARGFEISGWIRNERDGSVRCVIEGAADELERFVAAVRNAMNGSISNVVIDRAAATGEFQGFHVRR